MKSVASFFSAALGVASAQVDDSAVALKEWFTKAEGAVLSDKLEIRPRSATDPSLAFFAKEGIALDESLLTIPRSLVVTPSVPIVGDYVVGESEEYGQFEGVIRSQNVETGVFQVEVPGEEDEEPELLENVLPADVEHQDGGVDCGAVRRLMHELDQAEASVFAPWIRAIDATHRGHLPTTWSPEGQALLKEVLGKQEDSDEEILPPYGAFGLIDEHFVQACRGSRDIPSGIKAYTLTMQRNWGGDFIPMFDMLSHRNGKYTNVDHSPLHDPEEPVMVFASREIAAGEELYTSYNFCRDCGGRHHHYGTAELLRDYGFVEQYPQRWVFHTKNLEPLVFDVDEEPETGDHSVLWSHYGRLPDEEDMAFFTEQVKRLGEVGQARLQTKDAALPEQEWKIITEYHSALSVAMEQAAAEIKKSFEHEEYQMIDYDVEPEEEEDEEEEQEFDSEDEEFYEDQEEGEDDEL